MPGREIMAALTLSTETQETVAIVVIAIAVVFLGYVQAKENM